MTISASSVRFDDHSLWLDLSDGRVLGVPLAWFPRLLRASADEGAGYEISAEGNHWDSLDEDISIEGLLAGAGDQTHTTMKPSMRSL